MKLTSAIFVGAMMSSGSAFAQDVTLNYMGWNPAQLELERDAIAEFEAKHPNVTVRATAFKVKDYWPRLSTLAASGDLPDVFMMSSGFVQEWASSGNLANLSEYVSPKHLSEYFESAASFGVVDGARVAFPQNWVAPVMFYNIDMFEEAGVPLPKEDWSWDDFLSAAKALTKDKDGDGQIDQWGMWLFGRYAHIEPWVFRNGGRYLNEDGTAIELNEQAVNALKFLTDLTRVHKVAPLPQDMEGIRQQDVMPMGMAAMYVGGSWRIDNTRKVAGDAFKWAIAQVPEGPDATPATSRAYAWADMLSVSDESEHKDLAWEFIQHMVGKGRTAGDFPSGKVPAYIAIANDPEWLESEQQPKNKELLLKIGQQPAYAGFTKSWSAWRGYGVSGSAGMNGELDEVFNGRKSLEEAIEAFTANANDVLSR